MQKVNQETTKKSRVIEHLDGASGTSCPTTYTSTLTTLPDNCMCKTGKVYQLVSGSYTNYSCAEPPFKPTTT
jgi:hypothetical protein